MADPAVSARSGGAVGRKTFVDSRSDFLSCPFGTRQNVVRPAALHLPVLLWPVVHVGARHAATFSLTVVALAMSKLTHAQASVLSTQRQKASMEQPAVGWGLCRTHAWSWWPPEGGVMGVVVGVSTVVVPSARMRPREYRMRKPKARNQHRHSQAVARSLKESEGSRSLETDVMGEEHAKKAPS